MQNGDETGIDCGGSCSPCLSPDLDGDDDLPDTSGSCTSPTSTPFVDSTSCQLHARTILPFAVFATGRISIGDGSTVSGDINAIDTSAPPTLQPCNGCAPAASITLGNNVTVDAASTLRAPSVLLGAGTTVGSVDASAVTGSGTYATLAPYVAPVAPFALATYPPSQQNVAVTGLQTLPPGAYGDIVVNTGGTLVLQPGQFYTASLTVAPSAQLLTDGAARITTGSVSVGDSAIVAPTPRSGATLNLALVSNAADGQVLPAIRIGTT